MHCKNCGAQYRTRELSCPYCGTENFIGKIWMAQITDAEAEYELARREAGKGLPLYVMNRVVNRVLLISGGLIGLSFLAVFLFGILSGIRGQYHKTARGPELQQQVESLYQEEKLDELYQVMREYDLMDETGYEVYYEAAMLGYDYNQMRAHRMSFLELSEEKKAEDEYYLHNSIRHAGELLCKERSDPGNVLPENRELYAKMQQEAEAYLRGCLAFTDEEIREIKEMDYIYYSTLEDYTERARQRGAWR